MRHDEPDRHGFLLPASWRSCRRRGKELLEGGIEVQMVVSSPIPRAIETALGVLQGQEKNLDINVDPDLSGRGKAPKKVVQGADVLKEIAYLNSQRTVLVTSHGYHMEPVIHYLQSGKIVRPQDCARNAEYGDIIELIIKCNDSGTLLEANWLPTCQ